MLVSPNVTSRPAKPQQRIVLDVIDGNKPAAWLDPVFIPFEQFPIPFRNLCLCRNCLGGFSWLRAVWMKVIAGAI
jgi:hypothetical protein